MHQIKTRYARVVLLVFLLGNVASFVSAYVLPFGSYPKIEINGNNTLSFNLNEVEGSQSFYNDDNIGKDQTFSHRSNLYLTGELLKNVHLEATFAADQYSPDQTHWNLRYNGRDTRVLLGEFNANLAGNDYVLLNRSLQGVQVDLLLPKGNLTMLGSELSAPVRTDTFYGQNISGPYYLSASPIVDGSEIVTVNDQRKTRTTEYSIDYTSGILHFTTGTIISPADKVTVSYEVAANGLGGGRLYAVRATYPLRDNLQVGVSRLQLQANDRESAQREVRDQFLGNGTPGPFFLTSRPILAGSVTITINGVPVPKVTETGAPAYTLDSQTGHLLFSAGYEPPINKLVTVRYLVSIAGTKGNDRAVTGLDLNWSLPNGLNLNLQTALSDQTNDRSGSTARSALSVGANYSGPRFNAMTRYRDIGSQFTPLEMVGYRNVDREIEWSMRYAPTSTLSLTTSGNNTRLPFNPYAIGATNQFLMNDRTRLYSIDFHPEKWPRVTLQRHTRDSARVDADDLGNNTTTDTLRFTLARTHLNGTLEFNHVQTDSRQLLDPMNQDSPIFRYRGDTTSSLLNLMYQPNDRLDLGVNLAANRIEADSSNGKTETSGHNAQVNASYRASGNLTFTSSLAMNQTGSTQSISGESINALEDRTFTVNADWRPRRNMNVGLAYNRTRTEGGDYSNTTSDNVTANVGWQAHRLLSLNGYWSRQNLSYLTMPGGSVSNMVGINTEIGPLGKLKFNLDAQHLWGETSFAVSQMLATEAAARRTVPTRADGQYVTTVTGNRLTTLAGRVSYPIAKKQEIFLTADTMRSSGFPSESVKNSYGLGWNYFLNDNLTFTLDAGRVVYNDEANSSLDYHANQFNAQFSWNF